MQFQPTVGRAFVYACACVSLSVVIAAPLTRFGRAMGKMTMKSTHRVLGYSLVRSHRTFAFFALLASLARFPALIRSLAHPLTRTRAHGKEVFVYEFNASISCSFNPPPNLKRRNGRMDGRTDEPTFK